MKRILLLVMVVAAANAAVLAQPNQSYSHGDPSNDEQYMLELINRARANPTKEGVRLMDTDDASVQAAYQYFNINNAATKQAFTTYPQRPPMAFHPSLLQAARNHTADMVANNFQGHNGSNGSTLDQRYTAVGYQSQGQWGENVSAYSNSVWYGHCGLNVDWGTQNQIELGHRSNIMNFKNAIYTEIGIGITKTLGGLQSGTVGPYVITQDFGMRTIRYITGVVYDDKNSNGFYDPGEGLSGVRVEPSRGTYYAITSSSGGYAIPFTGSGAVTVVASGGPLTAPITQNTTFSSDNIKVDFIPVAQKPGAVTLLLPASKASVPRANVAFSWNAASFAEVYEIVVAKDQNFTPSSVVFTKEVSATGTTSDMPECGKTYYWRVRASNAVGDGAWSAALQFSTTGSAPGSPTLAGPKGAFSVDVSSTQSFTWSATAGASAYHIRLSTQANMSAPFFQDSTVGSNATNVDAAVLPSSGKFYWQVRSYNECGWSVWSSSAEATSTVTSVDEFTESGLAVSVVPNPVLDNGSIRISAPHDGPVNITIVDQMGRVMISGHQIESLSGLAAGMYTVIVDAVGARATTRFVKQ
jgi:uncharacterized protein YkwD